MKKILIFSILSVLFFNFTFASDLDDAITWMYDNGLTIHNTASKFNSTRSLRRDESAKFLVKFSKILGKTTYVKTVGQCNLSDVKLSWSDLTGIVVESCRLGLFQGTKGLFNPNKQITNSQIIAVLIRLIDGFQIETGLNHRSDNYYKKAQEIGLLEGLSMGNRTEFASRGNVAMLMYNANNYISNGPGGDTDSDIIGMGNCKDLPKKLDSCTEYKCQYENPITNDLIQREVMGILGESCIYVESLLDDWRMECAYDLDQRKLASDYYEAWFDSDSVDFGDSFGEDFSELKIKVNGKYIKNIIQDFIDNDVCVF